MKELKSVFEKNGWKYKIELKPDTTEDINDLEILMNPIKTIVSGKEEERNKPCQCGSGKKFKKCCGK